MTKTDRLWGGTLESITLSADFADMSLRVRSGDSAHVLQLLAISDIRFERATPLPWNYTEVTEVHARPSSAGLLIELVLWAEENPLVITCERGTIDGSPVVATA